MAKRDTSTVPKGKKKNPKDPKAKKKEPPKVSYHRQPTDITVDAWQSSLRMQFGKESVFGLENNGEHPVFSDFKVTNPENGTEYRVAIRSKVANTDNFCSCLDFKTNGLGVCKHIGFVMHHLEHKRGNKKLLKAGFRQPHSSIFIDYTAGRKIRMSIGTENEAAYTKVANQYFDTNLVITDKGLSQFDQLLNEARSIHDSFRCYDDALEYVIEQRERLRRQTRIAELFAKGNNSPIFKKIVKVPLYEYQKQGVIFAALAGRSLIADEMGLGKTIQAIGTAELMSREFGVSRVLVVCPTSLKYQWKTEVEKFTDSHIHVIEGGITSRQKQYDAIDTLYTVVGYHTVANDLHTLNTLGFDLVILDESQRIKNWATKTSAAIKRLKSPYAIVLTGTPIENKLEELYSIMQVIGQFRLPPLYLFLRQYQVVHESGKVIGYKNLHEIGKQLSDVLLRRRKKDVLKQLPARVDKTLLVAMTRQQTDIHDGLKTDVAQLVLKWQRQHFLNENDRKHLMLLLGQMRMVCDSTYILDQKTRYDTKVLETMCILEEFFANGAHQKAVIFSQWERMTRLIRMELEDRGIGYQYLHGGVPSKLRGGLLDTFREDPNCQVFLSTDAGGVGLNLQSASLVINLDIPWSPGLLEQRIGRVYRMGQKNAVQVINLVSKGGIEERLIGVLKFKDSLAKGVLDEGEDVIFMETSKFNDLMGEIKDITGDGAATDTEHKYTEDLEQEINQEMADIAAETPEETPQQPAEAPNIVSDEATPPQKGNAPETALPAPARRGRKPKVVPELATGNNERSPSGNADSERGTSPNSPQALIQNGVSFLSGLARTLSSPQETQKLVSSLTDRDETTGRVYLKIPVENEQAVSDALNVLGNLFKAFGGK